MTKQKTTTVDEMRVRLKDFDLDGYDVVGTKAVVVGEYIVFVETAHDQDVESPEEDGAWKVHSFNRRHRNFVHPDTFFEDEEAKADIEAKLEAGEAFWLDYYEHGQCDWSVSDGKHPVGVEYQWDGRRKAGLLVWVDKPEYLPKDYAKRLEMAESFADVYTMWCNGACYGYHIEAYKACRVEGGSVIYDSKDDYRFEEPVADESCWGYIGEEHLTDGKRDALRCVLGKLGVAVVEDAEGA